jgi:hypothetical protein
VFQIVTIRIVYVKSIMFNKGVSINMLVSTTIPGRSID